MQKFDAVSLIPLIAEIGAKYSFENYYKATFSTSIKSKNKPFIDSNTLLKCTNVLAGDTTALVYKKRYR